MVKYDGVVRFVREVRQEMRRVSWPTRRETLTSTAIILVLIMISALFFWFIDSIIAALVRVILGLGV
jgi:preprotein translocase subunit SecE